MTLARRSLLLIFAVVCSISCVAQKQADSGPQALLEHLTGQWVMKGVIGGQPVTHDVDAKWLLNREYLQLHEVSRSGPTYEAIVLIGWDTKAHEYRCLWLDTSGGDGLRPEAIASAARADNSIPFIFRISSSESLHTTFRYIGDSDTWTLRIEDQTNGKAQVFADVKIVRPAAGGSRQDPRILKLLPGAHPEPGVPF